DAAEADLPLLPELLHRRHHFAEDVGKAQGAGPARRLDPIVELEEVDALHAEPLEARVERARDRAGDVAKVGRVEPELRADLHARPQRPEHLAGVLLGLAVAVRRRGVEVVDAELHRPRDRALALGQRAADDEPADVAAAEPERRDPETRLAEISELHACASRWCRELFADAPRVVKRGGRL